MKSSSKLFLIAGANSIFFFICVFGLEGYMRACAALPALLVVMLTVAGITEVFYDD